MTEPIKFDLPRKIEKYLAVLSSIYAKDGKRDLQELIVNAHVQINEAWTADNWNGGAFGHAVHLVLPESLFLRVRKQKTEVQTQVRDDLNELHSVENEFVAEIILDLEDSEDPNWRERSGLLLSGVRLVHDDAAKRIWGENRFRLFLSHKTEVKKETSELSEQLAIFGISAFVAHENIQPTKEWQEEIENALATMDGFVALLTSDFHASNWTDQEVGFALARNVPLIAVRLDRDPYGFIGKFQALRASWDDAAIQIASLLIVSDRMVNAFTSALSQCHSFGDGNNLGQLLPNIKHLDEDQIDQIISAYNQNDQLRGAFAFNGAKPRDYGNGILPVLNRFSERKFVKDSALKIKET